MDTAARRCRSRALLSALVPISALLSAACAPHLHPAEVEDVLSRTLAAARRHHEAGMDTEAAVLMRAVASVDEAYPGLDELERAIDPAVRARARRGRLGMNRRLRPDVDRPFWQRALLYLPDRLCDALDIVTFDVHSGVGAYADYHVTRAFQMGGGVRSIAGLGLHDFRSLGLKVQAEGGITAVAVGSQNYVGAQAGTSGIQGGAGTLAGMHRPTGLLYQEFRDYWAIGLSATGSLFGLSADVHPLQIADLLAGFVGVDFLSDDLAHTRGLQLGPADPRLLREIWRLRGSRLTLEGYLEARRSGTLVPANAEAEGADRPARAPARDGAPLPAAPEEP